MRVASFPGRVWCLAGWLLLALAGAAFADDAFPVLTLIEGTESRELILEQIEAPAPASGAEPALSHQAWRRSSPPRGQIPGSGRPPSSR